MRVITAEAGYTVTGMADEQSTEIFDDLYLGLRAGGALRKQRRGEELTSEEREALGRWQRLSAWRKGVAIGGFAFGDVRPRVHARRPPVRPLAQGLVDHRRLDLALSPRRASAKTPASAARAETPPASHSVPRAPTVVTSTPPAASATSSAVLRIAVERGERAAVLLRRDTLVDQRSESGVLHARAPCLADEPPDDHEPERRSRTAR